MIGVMTTSEAMGRAQAEEKDLVMVTEKADPPIVKIIDLAKFKYQLQQREAEGRKKPERKKPRKSSLRHLLVKPTSKPAWSEFSNSWKEGIRCA